MYNYKMLCVVVYHQSNVHRLQYSAWRDLHVYSARIHLHKADLKNTQVIAVLYITQLSY